MDLEGEHRGWLWSDSWFGRLPTWFRHGLYWLLAGLTLAASLADDSTGPSETGGADVGAAVVVALLMFLVVVVMWVTLHERELVGPWRLVSRGLVLTVLVVAMTSIVLSWSTRAFAVDVLACGGPAEARVCDRPASAREVQAMVAWHAADALPGLAVNDSFGWERPARSSHPMAGAVVVFVRLWVLVGLLSLVALLWERWGPSRGEHTSREFVD